MRSKQVCALRKLEYIVKISPVKYLSFLSGVRSKVMTTDYVVDNFEVWVIFFAENRSHLFTTQH